MGRAGHRTAPTTAAAAALTALLLAGCTSGQPSPGEAGASGPASGAASSPTAGPASDPAPIASAPQTPAGPPFTAATKADEADPTGEGESFLSVTDIRTATHDGFDRIVLDLDGTGGGQPGWRVEYVDRATDDGSGNDVEVDGDAILRVVLSGTAAPTDSGVDVLSDDRLEPEGTESVEEIVYRHWFEGYTTTFLGLDEQRPFRTFLLKDPTRVVVDVEH